MRDPAMFQVNHEARKFVLQYYQRREGIRKGNNKRTCIYINPETDLLYSVINSALGTTNRCSEKEKCWYMSGDNVAFRLHGVHLRYDGAIMLCVPSWLRPEHSPKTMLLILDHESELERCFVRSRKYTSTGQVKEQVKSWTLELFRRLTTRWGRRGIVWTPPLVEVLSFDAFRGIVVSRGQTEEGTMALLQNLSSPL